MAGHAWVLMWNGWSCMGGDAGVTRTGSGR